MKIIVNGIEQSVVKTRLSYEDVIRLALGADAKNRELTVTFRKAVGRSDGSLRSGETVDICEGTVFNAVGTGDA